MWFMKYSVRKKDANSSTLVTEFCKRICQQLGYFRNKILSQATGQHFNLPWHSENDMKFTIIEQVRSSDPLYGREKLHMRRFNSLYGGINR